MADGKAGDRKAGDRKAGDRKAGDRKAGDRKVYLVPGFFGFSSLGRVSYFHRVAEVLEDAFRRRGRDVEVIECDTAPSGSITRRAERLRRTVIETGGLEARSIHFIGHSTGGLDVRLLISPGVALARDGSEDRIGQRTRAAVFVATPHHGTPLATFFTSFQGKNILLLLAVLATSKQGRLAIWAASRLLALVARIDDYVGRTETLLDELSDAVLRRMSLSEDDPIWAFLEQVSEDQGAILQLTPEAMHLFNAAVSDRPGVFYGSVATVAPRPPFAYGTRELFSARRGVMSAVFTLLYTLASRAHRHYPYPIPDPALHGPALGALQMGIDERTNDGIVPTPSQLHGRLLAAVLGDHLDVVGQFAREDEALSDWLPSGARFTEERFRDVWERVADALVGAESPDADR